MGGCGVLRGEAGVVSVGRRRVGSPSGGRGCGFCGREARVFLVREGGCGRRRLEAGVGRCSLWGEAVVGFGVRRVWPWISGRYGLRGEAGATFGVRRVWILSGGGGGRWMWLPQFGQGWVEIE